MYAFLYVVPLAVRYNLYDHSKRNKIMEMDHACNAVADHNRDCWMYHSVIFIEPTGYLIKDNQSELK